MNDALLGKMWKTKSSRFNAHARLKTRHWLSIAATSILSFYVFIASLLPLAISKFGEGEISRAISLVTIIISVFLIIITLLETAKNYLGEADKMHQCALEISRLYNGFQALTLEEAEVRRTEFTTSYSDILNAYEINHKDIDFLKFQLSFCRDLRISGLELFFARARYIIMWVSEYWLYTTLMIAPPIAILIYYYG